MVFHSNEIAAVYISSKPDHCEGKIGKKIKYCKHKRVLLDIEKEQLDFLCDIYFHLLFLDYICECL